MEELYVLTFTNDDDDVEFGTDDPTGNLNKIMFFLLDWPVRKQACFYN